MQIFVRGIDDAVRSICIPETSTVAELKALLHVDEALLTYGATILDDDKAPLVKFGISDEANIDVSFRLLGGKVHGSLARAGKVRAQTPKVEKQEKKKKKTGRAARRIQYNRRFVNIAISGIGRKRGPNSNAA
uniref:40S ribosomal protein S30 n=1 Tax=Elaeophora elaphi TaxID=1147741 RepID=A0A0R3RVW1_9BILA